MKRPAAATNVKGRGDYVRRYALVLATLFLVSCANRSLNSPQGPSAVPMQAQKPQFAGEVPTSPEWQSTVDGDKQWASVDIDTKGFGATDFAYAEAGDACGREGATIVPWTHLEKRDGRMQAPLTLEKLSITRTIKGAGNVMSLLKEGRSQLTDMLRNHVVEHVGLGVEAGERRIYCNCHRCANSGGWAFADHTLSAGRRPLW